MIMQEIIPVYMAGYHDQAQSLPAAYRLGVSTRAVWVEKPAEGTQFALQSNTSTSAPASCVFLYVYKLVWHGVPFSIYTGWGDSLLSATFRIEEELIDQVISFVVDHSTNRCPAGDSFARTFHLQDGRTITVKLAGSKTNFDIDSKTGHLRKCDVRPLVRRLLDEGTSFSVQSRITSPFAFTFKISQHRA